MTPLPVLAARRDRDAPDRTPGSVGTDAARRTIIGKCRSLRALVQIARALAADRGLHDGIDVPGRQAIARGADAVDVDADGRLAEGPQHRQIGDARHLGQHRGDGVGGLFQRLQIVAVHLDGILALDAGCRLFDVVLDVLREIELDARELLPQRLGHVLRELVLVDSGRPGVEGLQRHEELGIEETGGVGAVVGPAVLRDHGLHLGILAHQHAHAIDVRVAVLERHRLRETSHGPTDFPPRAWAGTRGPASAPRTRRRARAARYPRR